MKLPYRRDRCSRLMPSSAATDEILIVSPRSRRLPITALSLASVTETRARCVVNAPCRILSDGVPSTMGGHFTTLGDIHMRSTRRLLWSEEEAGTS